MHELSSRFSMILMTSLAAWSLGACNGEPDPPLRGGPREPVAATSEVIAHGPDAGSRVADGAELFRVNCSGCHGVDGDGRGATQIDRPARSFREGGFAFGDTPEALYRTVSVGMPGTNPMPGFMAVLSEAERRAIVAHVLTLVPARNEATAAERHLVAHGRPVIARGILPPIAEGLPQRPRGLLVGHPEGLTFEYRIDDVRLLGVRQGELADRKDWGGRGGSELVPLGRLLHVVGGGDPPATWSRLDGGKSTPLRARMTGSFVRADRAGVRYDLLDESGRRQASIEEATHAAGTSAGSGYSRTFTVAPGSDEPDLILALESPKSGSTWIGGRPTAADATPRLRLDSARWFVRQDGPEAFVAFRFDGAPGTSLVLADEGLLLQLRTSLFGEREPLRFAVVPTATWSPELARKLEAEVSR